MVSSVIVLAEEDVLPPLARAAFIISWTREELSLPTVGAQRVIAAKVASAVGEMGVLDTMDQEDDELAVGLRETKQYSQLGELQGLQSCRVVTDELTPVEEALQVLACDISEDVFENLTLAALP